MQKNVLLFAKSAHCTDPKFQSRSQGGACWLMRFSDAEYSIPTEHQVSILVHSNIGSMMWHY